MSEPPHDLPDTGGTLEDKPAVGGVPSLYGYYSKKRAAGAKFVKQLKALKIDQFETADLQRVRAELDTLDSLWRKTATLRAAARSCDAGRTGVR